MKVLDIKPFFYTIGYTEGAVSNQGYSFNEAGQSFNEAGVTFGGLYGNQDDKPKLSKVVDAQPL